MPSTMLKTCPGCLGSGVKPNTGFIFYTCEGCKGRGWIEDVLPLNITPNENITEVKKPMEKRLNSTATQIEGRPIYEPGLCDAQKIPPNPIFTKTGQDIYEEINRLDLELTDLKTTIGLIKRSGKRLRYSEVLLQKEYDALYMVYQQKLLKEYKPL